MRYRRSAGIHGTSPRHATGLALGRARQILARAAPLAAVLGLAQASLQRTQTLARAQQLSGGPGKGAEGHEEEERVEEGEADGASDEGGHLGEEGELAREHEAGAAEGGHPARQHRHPHHRRRLFHLAPPALLLRVRVNVAEVHLQIGTGVGGRSEADQCKGRAGIPCSRRRGR